MEDKIQPLIVPAVLENEGIQGLSVNNTGSHSEDKNSLDLLLRELNQYYKILARFGADPEIIAQVFRQVNIGGNSGTGRSKRQLLILCTTFSNRNSTHLGPS